MDEETKAYIDELIEKALSEGKKEDDPYIKDLRELKEYNDHEYYDEMYRYHIPMSVEERYNDATKELELPFGQISFVEIFWRQNRDSWRHPITSM